MTRYTGISPAAPCIMDRSAAHAFTGSSWVYQGCACILGMQGGEVFFALRCWHLWKHVILATVHY